MSDFGLRRGEYKIIRVDGTEEVIGQRPDFEAIHKALGCNVLDTVILTHDESRNPDIVMLVDDTGAVTRRPVNPKATELYHATCKPGNPGSIHGDVALAHDQDFADFAS